MYPRAFIVASLIVLVGAIQGANAACGPGFTDAGGGLCRHDFVYTGAAETIVVPNGIGVATIVASGGAGGTSLEDEGVASEGGLGGRMTTTVPVVPGDTLTVLVGQAGADGVLAPAGPGGWPDGGQASSRYGGNGGGGSYVFDSTGLLVAAGGGGGGGHDYNPAWAGDPNQLNHGGAGSGADALDGHSVHFKGSSDPRYGSPGAGKGATTTAPGVGGTPDLPSSWSGFGISTGETGWGPTESTDILGKGGDSYRPTDSAGVGFAGAGGGGYFGGGGGGTIDAMVSGGGGGGGSGFATPAATASTPETGVEAGDGLVRITYDSNQAPPTTSTTVIIPTTSSTSTSAPVSTTLTSTTVPTTTESSTTTTSASPTTTTAPPVACAPAPVTPCRAAVAAKSSITIADNANPAKDAFKWKWAGEATVGEFQDPAGGTPALRVCLYDASGAAQPLMAADIPPGGSCDGKPCWKITGKATAPTGYKYKNAAQTPDGVVAATLKAGATPKAQVSVKAKGANLRNPALPLTPPVTAQFVVTDGAGTACWEATFGAPKTNDGVKFKAKNP